MTDDNALIPIDDDDIENGLILLEGVSAVLVTVPQPSMREAIDSWLRATTDSSSLRYDDLLRDKARPVCDFFAFTGKAPEQVSPMDVKAFTRQLEDRGLAQATVYSMISRISSFYKWLNDLPGFKGQLPNPVAAARPKSPKAYQSEKTKSLTDEEVVALAGVIRARAESGDVVGVRDYAMFITYLLTGLRRTEVTNLRWGNINFSGFTPTITFRAKGGSVLTREVDDRIRETTLDYLNAAGRLSTMQPDSAVWVSHDRANVGKGKPLTGHAFAKNLKAYAKEAGLSHIHMHQTRHTYARIVADQTGSIVETQDALGHANATTTKIYVQRVGVKKDKHGDKVARRLGL